MKIIDRNIFLMKNYSDKDLNEMANLAKANNCKTADRRRSVSKARVSTPEGRRHRGGR